MTLPQRFWSKIAVDSNGCWIWTGATRSGYGAYWDRGRVRRAHRVAYEALVGLIADGLVLDHLCGVLACVYPAHLEPVTQRTNLHRSDRFWATRHFGRDAA